MNLQETMDFIHQTDWKGSRLGLERMADLMARLGNPQNDLHFVHVAGTNGKGSVCITLSSILTAAGYCTGLYTSPHLFRLNERMKINDMDISDKDLIALAERVKPVVQQMEDQPTEFEIITAMAFLYFKQQQCDVVVLEVGLGGRLDATNIIKPPIVAVICNIGLEHTEILGDTLEKIAKEKAGIIKERTTTVLYGQCQEVENVIRQRCQFTQSKLRITDALLQRQISESLDGQILDYRNRKNLRLHLLGTYQYKNAAVALDTVDVLKHNGYSISEESIANGFAKVEWPGRFEVLQRNPLVLVDGAHNPNGVDELAVCLEHYLPDKKVTFIMGVMADKDYRTMLRTILPFAEQVITVTPENDRALSSAKLKKEIEAVSHTPAFDAGGVKEGLDYAVRNNADDCIICAFGSLYQVGEIRANFHKYQSNISEN